MKNAVASRPAANEPRSSNLPSHEVFMVEGEGDNAFWTKVGAAWAIKNGEGLSVQLSAIPVTGRMVILPRKERAERGE